MSRPRRGDFVTLTDGVYMANPTIVHPLACVCDRCKVIPPADRAAKPVTHRLLRKSPFPDDLLKSITFSRELKSRVEAELAVACEDNPRVEMSLADVCELYFDANPRKVSAETIERDRINARNICRLISPLIPPDAIDEPVAVRYRNTREREGARPRTILNELSFLKMLLTFGHKWQRETGMDGVRLGKVPDVGEWESPGVALTVDEIGALLEVANDRDRSLIIVGVTTMLRRKPLLGLRAEWVDRKGRWLVVPAEMQKKGHAKRRYGLTVPISSWTVDSLPAMESGLLWPSRDTGKALTSPARILMALRMRSGVREFSLHDLRTTGATWLKEAGVDELTIAVLLGHRTTFDAASGTFSAESRNVTRGYTKLFESTLREAVAVFDEKRKAIARKASGLRLA